MGPSNDWYVPGFFIKWLHSKLVVVLIALSHPAEDIWADWEDNWADKNGHLSVKKWTFERNGKWTFLSRFPVHLYMWMGVPSVSQVKDRFQPLHVAPAQNYVKAMYKFCKTFICGSQSYLYISTGSVLVAQGSDIPKWFPNRCIPDTIHRQLSSAFDM